LNHLCSITRAFINEDSDRRVRGAIPELLAQQPVMLDWLADDVFMAEKGDFEPQYENQKPCFFLCLEFRFSEQNGEIQPEKVTQKIARKKVCIINRLYFLAKRGDSNPR
jgi:hypothetical protein